MNDISHSDELSAHVDGPGRGNDSAVAGHWLLARLGKRVLRPGGVELTRKLLCDAQLADADVVEFAPGLGRTATEIIGHRPRSYRGVDADPGAVRAVQPIVAGYGGVQLADAAQTGLAGASADVVVGEAMLTMQGEKAKDAIVAEAVRLLKPGGRYAIHELALSPDDLSDSVKTDVRQALARSIKVNARPLTTAEWRHRLAQHGLVVDRVQTAPMALLQPRRLLVDEGVLGTLRFVRNLLTRPGARRRVWAMRSTFGQYRDHLLAVAVVAHKPTHG
ncbi:MAG: methyltransferase domain-containing protein [Microlunatus sp.]|nr:methyltransferase domain-containing protein [Microlunatus sp.]